MKKILIILGIIVLLIIIGLFIYIKLVPNNFPCFPPLCMPGRLAPNSSTIGWKTYTNEKASYSIKYPEGTLLREETPYYNEDVNNIIFNWPYKKEFIELSILSLVKGPNWYGSEICKKTSSVVVINNIEWQKLNCTKSFFGAPSHIIEKYLYETDNMLYQLVLDYGQKMVDENRSDMESIINTFKFTK